MLLQRGVLIESSVNSLRLSIKFQRCDECEAYFKAKLCRFVGRRAEDFIVVRRKPRIGWDFTFLITVYHLRNIFQRQLLIDFIVDFITDMETTISEMRYGLCYRGKAIAFEWLREFQ